jgi:hypothetical protein
MKPIWTMKKGGLASVRCEGRRRLETVMYNGSRMPTRAPLGATLEESEMNLSGGRFHNYTADILEHHYDMVIPADYDGFLGNMSSRPGRWSMRPLTLEMKVVADRVNEETTVYSNRNQRVYVSDEGALFFLQMTLDAQPEFKSKK